MAAYRAFTRSWTTAEANSVDRSGRILPASGRKVAPLCRFASLTLGRGMPLRAAQPFALRLFAQTPKFPQ
jgi:hypothetical protein